MKAITTILNISVSDFGICKFDLSDMLHIYPPANMDYSVLTDREKSILDKVITKFSAYRAKDIVEYMHKEKAYTETRPGEIILFSLAKEIRKF